MPSWNAGLLGVTALLLLTGCLSLGRAPTLPEAPEVGLLIRTSGEPQWGGDLFNLSGETRLAYRVVIHDDGHAAACIMVGHVLGPWGKVGLSSPYSCKDASEFEPATDVVTLPAGEYTLVAHLDRCGVGDCGASIVFVGEPAGNVHLVQSFSAGAS